MLNLVKFCHVTRCSFSGEMQSERIERIHFAEISEVSFSIVINTIFRLIDSLHKSEDFGHPKHVRGTTPSLASRLAMTQGQPRPNC